MSNNPNNEIDEYKKEYYEEIRNIGVQVENLNELKISNDILAAEVSLRRVFGDEIPNEKYDELENDDNKAVSKLDAGAIEFDGTVRDICERVVDSKFDSELDILMTFVQEG